MSLDKMSLEELLLERHKLEEDKAKIYQIYYKLYELDTKEHDKKIKTIQTYLYARSAAL